MAGLTFGIGGGPARADDPCIGDAKQQFIECKGDCKEGYQLAKDECLNRDHECVEICRAIREECRLATGVDAALNVCRDQLRTAKTACRNTHAEGSAALDACIDGAQIVSFQCRRAARSAARPDLKLCRLDFRGCAKACPPPDEPGEVVDPVACKADAKTVQITCKTDCREDLQVQKDLCLDRDHVCVEGCRGDRDTCREPIEDQLDADIATCNEARDTTVEGCGDQVCIDDAYVAAFQCRDASREIARPGIQGCRDGFQTCAEGCPPAS